MQLSSFDEKKTAEWFASLGFEPAIGPGYMRAEGPLIWVVEDDIKRVGYYKRLEAAPSFALIERAAAPMRDAKGPQYSQVYTRGLVDYFALFDVSSASTVKQSNYVLPRVVSVRKDALLYDPAGRSLADLMRLD